MRAAIDGKLGEVQRLLSAGADPNVLVDGQVPLSWAVYHGYKKVAEALLDHGARTDLGNGFPAAGGPVHAATNGGAQFIRLLISRGADPNQKGDDNGRPLQRAVVDAGDKVGVIRALLDGGADPNLTDKKGDSALSNAISEGQARIVALLLAGKGDPNGSRSKRKWSHLHHAAAVGSADVVRALLRAGGRLDARDTKGWTPLHAAAQFDSSAVAKLLVAEGADPSAKTKGGETPLEIAEANGSDSVIKVLRKRKRGALKSHRR